MANEEPSDLRSRVDATALRELDVEIAVRESELATMRRARAAIAGDVERGECAGSAASCGNEAQESA